MKIYIAGKITGLVYEDALRQFAEAERFLAELGHEPVNPMKENGLDGDGNQHAWAEYMKRDIPHLLGCDGIYLLPNWVASKGACLEKHIAAELGMKIIKAAPIDHIRCQADGCDIWFIQTDNDAEVDLCHKCEAALMRTEAAV